jgi:hypothetical protein
MYFFFKFYLMGHVLMPYTIGNSDVLAIGNSDVLTPSPTCYTAFQRLLGGKKGGPEVLLAIGFVEQDGKLVVTDLDVEWLKVASGELVVAAKRGPFY